MMEISFSSKKTMKRMQNKGKKKPHFVSEARILRQYERSNQVTCHVLYPLGIDSANILYIVNNATCFNVFN